MLLRAQSWQQQWLQLRQRLWGLMMMQPLELLQVQSWHQLQEVEADSGESCTSTTVMLLQAQSWQQQWLQLRQHDATSGMAPSTELASVAGS